MDTAPGLLVRYEAPGIDIAPDGASGGMVHRPRALPPIRTFTVGPGVPPGQPADGIGRVADYHRRLGVSPTPEHACTTTNQYATVAIPPPRHRPATRTDPPPRRPHATLVSRDSSEVLARLLKTISDRWTGADLPTTPVVVHHDDPRFGAFTVSCTWQPRAATITGPWTTLVIAAPPQPTIAARAVKPPRVTATGRHDVTLTVDGAVVPFDLGRRALRRATYNVTTTVAGRSYRLRQCRATRADLERD